MSNAALLHQLQYLLLRCCINSNTRFWDPAS